MCIPLVSAENIIYNLYTVLLFKNLRNSKFQLLSPKVLDNGLWTHGHLCFSQQCVRVSFSSCAHQYSMLSIIFIFANLIFKKREWGGALFQGYWAIRRPPRLACQVLSVVLSLWSSTSWTGFGAQNLCIPMADQPPSGTKLPMSTLPLPSGELLTPLPSYLWLSLPAGEKGHHCLLTHSAGGWKKGVVPQQRGRNRGNTITTGSSLDSRRPRILKGGTGLVYILVSLTLTITHTSVTEANPPHQSQAAHGLFFYCRHLHQ